MSIPLLIEALCTMKAIIISREQDGDRRRRIQASIPDLLDWSFLDASDGHRPGTLDVRYAKLIPRAFWGNEKIKPGAFGCFVSHYRAWLECLRVNSPVLILEDDVCFSRGHFLNIDAVNSHAWDIVLVNRATVAWNFLNQEYKATRLIPFVSLRRRLALRASRVSMERNIGDARIVTSLREIVKSLVESSVTPDSHDTPGACGYILTPEGAKKTLALADSLGVVVGVDWFMLGSAMSGTTLSGKWDLPGKVARYFRNTEPVNVGVSGAWMVESIDADVGGSVINHAQLFSIEEYAAKIGLCQKVKND